MEKILEILTFQNFHISINFIFFLAGCIILVKGSDFFIDSAVYFARRFKVSEIVIGLTLVSIGTSLPELAANINSAINGRSAIAMGNVTGSNVTNIGLVIGAAGLILGKIKVPGKLLKRDMIFMIGVTVIFLCMSYLFDGQVFQINRIESVIMLVLLIFYMIYLFKFNKEDVDHEIQEHEEGKIKSMGIAVLMLFLGFASIFIGSELMIKNVIQIAEKLYISDGVIGATIVALATSFPELSVTIVGIIKKKSDISLGNIVGSNIFNILGVLGVTGLISNITIINANGNPDFQMLLWTLPITLLIALLLFVFMLIKKQINRIKAVIFILVYVVFMIVNFIGLIKWFPCLQ